MKTIFLKFFTMLILIFILVGCNNVVENNQSNNDKEDENVITGITKGMVEQGDSNINPKSVVGYVGDPMPFFEDGVMNVFLSSRW